MAYSQMFIRGNLIEIVSSFKASDGSNTEPTTATATISYTDTAGDAQTDEITMVKLANGNWRAIWDSSGAAPCTVDWCAEAAGALVAVDQGTFKLVANSANVGDPPPDPGP